MLVLHAFWLPGVGAGVWAEDSDLAVTSPSQALRRARPHPFAVSGSILTTLVGGTASTGTLLLPSLRRSPLDSPELYRISPRSRGGATPSALEWSVPVALLDPDAAGDALARFTDPDGAADEGAGPDGAGDDPADAADVRPAASARHLVELARYADELVDRGRVLPTLAGDEHGVDARWRVMLTGPDAALVPSREPVARPSRTRERSTRHDRRRTRAPAAAGLVPASAAGPEACEATGSRGMARRAHWRRSPHRRRPRRARRARAAAAAVDRGAS